MYIADRMKEIDSSGIRKAFDLAQRMDDPINLSIGQPDYGPPQEVITSTIKALNDGHNRYTLTQGLEDLRAEIRRHLKESKGFEPEEVMITSGVAGGIMLAFLTLLNPGDRVVIPDPYFVIYKHLASLVGAVPVYLDTYPDFEVTAEGLERALQEKTKLVIINNPCNPTGALIAGNRLKDIAELSAKKGAMILSDEVYDFFAYGVPHECMGRHSESVLVLGGYSKIFGIPGWRIGYAAGAREVIGEMTKLQQYSFVCAPSVLQQGVVGALGVDMSKHLSEYRRKRDMICDGLEGLYRFARPKGAFYLFPEAPGGSGSAFVQRAIEKKLILVPGSVFSERDTHFRISFAAADDTLHRGIEALRSLA